MFSVVIALIVEIIAVIPDSVSTLHLCNVYIYVQKYKHRSGLKKRFGRERTCTSFTAWNLCYGLEIREHVQHILTQSQTLSTGTGIVNISIKKLRYCLLCTVSTFLFCCFPPAPPLGSWWRESENIKTAPSALIYDFRYHFANTEYSCTHATRGELVPLLCRTHQAHAFVCIWLQKPCKCV